MSTFLVIVLTVVIGAFLFFQIRGLVRDIKKRKELKKTSDEKLEQADRKNVSNGE